MIGRLRSMLRIQPGEGVRVLIMLVYSAAAIGGVLTVGYNGVGQTLFLSRLPASAVPFTFILPAVSIVLTLVLYNTLAPRLPLPRLAAGSSALLLLVGLAFRLLLATGYGRSFPVLAGIFLYCETAASIMIMQFWTFAGQLFNPRQARRLFGLIAAGGTLSSAGAGLSMAALVRLIGVDNLIAVVAGSLGVCGVCSVALRGHLPRSPVRYPPIQGRAGSSGTGGLGHDLAAFWRSPLLRAITVLTVLVSLLINIAAYQFFLALQASYAGRGAALASFLGVFGFWTGIAALVMQLLVTSFVMTRFGIFSAQLFFPVAMALSGASVLLARGALGATALSRAADPVFRRTIHDASFNALYLPVPADLRRRCRTLLEVVYAVTFGLAGVAFLLLQGVRAWMYQYWSVPVVVLAACWIVALVWVRRTYVRALSQSVRARRLDFDDLTLDFADETTVQVLLSVLHGDDDLRVLHVLHLIDEAPGNIWLPHVAALLEHPSPQVRARALRYLERSGSHAYTRRIVALLDAPEDEVRSAAVEALCAVDPSTVADWIAPFLDDSDLRTAGAAVAGLLRYGDKVHGLLAATRLRAMLASDNPAARREAAHVLGALAGHALDPSILSLLQDLDLRSHVTLDQQGAPTGTPIAHLVRLLGDAATRSAAADALVRYGDDALSMLDILFADRTQDRATREEVPRIIHRIGGRVAVQILLRHTGEPDPVVRASIYRALARLRDKNPYIPIDESALVTQLMAEMRGCFALCIARADLTEIDEDVLLSAALTDRVDQGLERIISLLEALYPGRALTQAGHALHSSGNGVSAMTIELLDSLVERRVGELLLPLLEGPVEKVIAIGRTHLGIARRSRVERLGELAEDADLWLRACAIFRIGTLRDPGIASAVLSALDSDDPLVCETALAACKALLPPSELSQILTSQAQDCRFPAVRRYARSLLQGMEAA